MHAGFQELSRRFAAVDLNGLGADQIGAAMVGTMLAAIQTSQAVRDAVMGASSATPAQALFERLADVARAAGVYSPPRPKILGALSLGKSHDKTVQTVLVTLDGIDLGAGAPSEVANVFYGLPIEGRRGYESCQAVTQHRYEFDRFVAWAEQERRVLAFTGSDFAKQVAA